MGNLKGAGWKATCEYLIKVGGSDALDRVKAALTPEDRAIFSKPILPITWLDYSAFMRFMLLADKVLGKGDMQIVKDASVYSAQQDLRGIYKIFISFTSPEFIIKNVGVMWRQYYDSGSITVEGKQEKSGALKLVNFPDIPLHHDADQLPYMEECLRLSGAKNVRGSHPKCIARGDDCCIFRFSWA